MADVLTHIDTLDMEVAPQEELDVTVGSPMEHSRVLSITKNGKHVVSEYDLAEVDVYIPPFAKYLSQPILDMYLFINCELTDDLDLRGLDVSRITSFKFINPNRKSTVTSIDLRGWRFDSITGNRICNLFEWCTKVKTIKGIEHLVTDKITQVSSLFAYCYKLTDIGDTSEWDFSNVIGVNSMFYACEELEIIDGSQWDWTNVTGTMQNTFSVGGNKMKSWIGSHTLEEVERGDVVCFRGLGTNIVRIQTGTWYNRYIRYSSILAMLNGMADRTGMDTPGSFEIGGDKNWGEFSHLPNDDDTLPTSDVLSARQAVVRAICAKKNYNLVL